MPVQVIRETHEAPAHVQERLTRAGGLNHFGEPNYRVVWGWNRLTPIGGKWEDNGRVEIRMEPKYPQVNRWHVEKWLPADAYGTPEMWDLTTREHGILALGPYPQRGEYEHCMTIEGLDGGFLQLTPTIVEQIARRIEFSRSLRRTKQAKRDREVKKEDDYVNWAVERMDDTATWSYTPHSYLPANLKEKMEATA